MCASDGIAEAVASLRYLEPPQDHDLEPSTFEIPVSDLEIAERPSFKDHLDYLEAAEHQATAEDLKIRQTNDVLTAPTEELIHVFKEDRKIPLTFGRIIALAGDFYTNREPTKGSDIGLNYAPICGALQKSNTTPLKRFENAVNSLLQDRDGYLSAIMDLLDHEHRTIDHARDLGKSISKTYHEGGIEDHFNPDNCKLPSDKQYFDALQDSWQETFKHPSYNVLLSMYAWLAYTNVDHFGDDAVKAYCVGHASALRLAAEAHQEQDATKKCQKLKVAYVHEAFAAHYLTDLFSAGHLRPARRYLHTQNRLEMAGAGVMQWDKLGGKPEVPIWDYQQRYMHDDDCATGLLVRNGKGEQWIAYGDKQFFEPKNAVNRARATHCLQASVDEIYNKGFQQGWNPIPTNSPEDENSWEEYSSSFVAKKLMPLPMTAVKSSNWMESWGQCDVHNPAPLWIAGTPNSQDRVADHDFTLRKDVNDHSNFARVDASPAAAGQSTFFPGLPGIPYENEACKRVRDAPFRGHDQFATQSVMDGLLSGSFVQVQDLVRNVAAPEDGKLICVNFWNPALVQISSKVQQTFTIRNRAINVFDVSNLPDSAIPLHWALQNSANLLETTLYGFYWVTEGSKHARIAFGNTRFQSWIGKMGERQKLNLSESWEARSFPGLEMTTLSSNLPVSSANLTRFLFDNFFSEEEDQSESMFNNRPRQIMAVSMLPDKKVQIAICDDRLIAWIDSPFNSIHSLQSSCFGFAKAINKDHRQKNLLLCNANFSGNNSKLDLYEYKFDGAEDPKQVKVIDAHSKLECRISSDEEGSSSVLVGDVLGVGSDQVVVISGDYNNPEIQLYSRSMESSAPSAFTLAGRNAFDEGEYCDDKMIRPYLTALVPSGTGKGLDVLRIALHQRKDGQKYLYFHTHVRSTTSTPGPKSVIWKQYQPAESTSVRDKLAESPDAHYFHIRFIPTRREVMVRGKMAIVPAILEVFSWYGVVGVRMFAASTPNGCDYELDGQQPFLGQTSIGSGLGCAGDWGHGFLPWNNEDRWIDSNVFIPLSGSKEAQGSWGMTLDDRDRELVRGWEVEKRPQ
ncbi:uncharacterized protein N7498_004701 [Penicillium cinerascens]|uniref:Uncharacterized protein n=1 Tax=Penicillium cinerascens TaxID=70096 RepID=A0A9W9SZJ2_9EURO|nr:uncharacterized protein N7498_004701 [Penicillium cinerascens]KAJ5203822.1 hypothetical protein N7498_004701 [Penicillium cinerascens]